MCFPKLYCFIICSSSNFHDKSFPWSSFHATYISRKAHSLHLSKAISVSNWIQWTSYHPTIISQFFQLTPNIFPNHQRKDNIACQVSLCFCSVISLAFSLDTPCGTCLLSAASNALARASEFPAAPLGTPSEVPPRRCPVGPVPQSCQAGTCSETSQTGVFFISDVIQNIWATELH